MKTWGCLPQFSGVLYGYRSCVTVTISSDSITSVYATIKRYFIVGDVNNSAMAIDQICQYIIKSASTNPQRTHV